ncbi:MAG: cobalamin biosynthesis protein, partial [Muribaculaceae bacterium]|nr:cobalamin biosynthesis protein [Muribaculaceae bacterium]
MVGDANLTGYALVTLPLLAGWILDRFLGDPSWLPHPVVGFGKAISFFEHRLNKGSRRVLKGGAVAIGLIVVVFI